MASPVFYSLSLSLGMVKLHIVWKSVDSVDVALGTHSSQPLMHEFFRAPLTFSLLGIEGP